MLIAALIALFIKDQLDIYLLESRGQISFAKVQNYLLDFLHDSKATAPAQAGAESSGSHEQTPPSAQVRSSTAKEEAWRDWYAAVAPRQCLQPVLKEDFVACTDVRIKARRVFENSWNAEK